MSGFFIDLDKNPYSLDYPYSIHLLITNICNQKCPICYYKSMKKSFMSWAFLKNLVKQSAGKISWIAIGGGEPTLHPHIFDFLKLCKDNCIKTSITTNGTTEIYPPADRIAISLVSLDPAVNSLYYSYSPNSVLRSISEYKNLVSDIVINSPFVKLDYLKQILDLGYMTNILLLKPFNPNLDYISLADFLKTTKYKNFLLDACLALYLKQNKLLELVSPVCKQGKSSMSIDSNYFVAKCSNMGPKYRFTNLKDAWASIREKMLLFQEDRNFCYNKEGI